VKVRLTIELEVRDAKSIDDLRDALVAHSVENARVSWDDYLDMFDHAHHAAVVDIEEIG
jgi:hypothetical protein